MFDRATILEDTERYTEALRAYDLVLALKSDFTEALYRRFDDGCFQGRMHDTFQEVTAAR